ncbi:hypothetical protein [Paractinoplanes maris]|uniref:hypothetical protein n=1 Tax=Paractinoplanes maris TaxID=1734446 RepID=UPI0020216395|nr:hypothetical protein [Actinoplanes maris]
MNAGDEREAQLKTRVAELLPPGETFRAAIWVSRADGRPDGPVTRAEISPWRFRRPAAETRRGVNGAPRSHAVALDEHIRTVNDPRVLALTDRRLLLLSKRPGSWRDILRLTSGPLPPLRLRWECPRADLTASTEQGGRLHLTFADRSAITLLTPTARVQAFLAA